MIKYFLIGITILFIPMIVEGTIKVGLIGDSICCSYAISYPIYPYQCIDYLLERDLDKEGYAIRVINYSISGSRTDTGVNRLKQMISLDKPDILIIALGINDAFRLIEFEKIKANLSEMINLASINHIRVLLGFVDASHLPWNSHPEKYLSHLKSIYESLAKEYPHVILFPFLTPMLTMNADYHVGDHIHPNPMGLQFIANTIKTYLKSVLKQINQDLAVKVDQTPQN